MSDKQTVTTNIIYAVGYAENASIFKRLRYKIIERLILDLSVVANVTVNGSVSVPNGNDALLKNITTGAVKSKALTKKDFIEAYALRSNMTEHVTNYGLNREGYKRYALPCSCGDNGCSGWAMVLESCVIDHLEVGSHD